MYGPVAIIEASNPLHGFGHVGFDEDLVGRQTFIRRPFITPIGCIYVDEASRSCNVDTTTRWNVHVAHRRYDQSIGACRFIRAWIVERLLGEVPCEDRWVSWVENDLSEREEATEAGA